MIMGDFSYGEINWKNGTSPNELTKRATPFVETLRDLYLHQHITEPTHYRADQHLNALDLIITNEEGMIHNLALNAPVEINIIYVSLLISCVTLRCQPKKHRNFNTIREVMLI